jgi:hypothetical protein
MLILSRVKLKEFFSGYQFLHLAHLVMFIPILLLWLGEGERSSLMHIGIIAVVLFNFIYKRVKLKFWHISILTVFFLTFSVLGHYRYWLTRAIANNDITELQKGLGHIKPHWFFPAEFSAINFSLTGSIFLDQPARLGETYAGSLYQAVPRFLYGTASKPKALSQEFGTEIRQLTEFPQNFGVGMSPLAEGFINFDILGIVFTIFLWGLIINNFNRKIMSTTNPYEVIFFSTMAPLAWFFFRLPFSTVLNYFIRNLFIMVFLYLLFKVIQFMRENLIVRSND